MATYYTIREVAEKLGGISVQAVHKLIKRDRLKASRREVYPGFEVFQVSASQLADYLKHRRGPGRPKTEEKAAS